MILSNPMEWDSKSPSAWRRLVRYVYVWPNEAQPSAKLTNEKAVSAFFSRRTRNNFCKNEVYRWETKAFLAETATSLRFCNVIVWLCLFVTFPGTTCWNYAERSIINISKRIKCAVK